MADNNSYEINVTLDDFNGIITKNPNGDGTYNVTYTNLKPEQINAIGAAIETAMQNNLNPIALSGNYNDLTGAPSLPNSALETVEHEPDEEHQETWTSQEVKKFSDVAFSGKTSDLNNDSGFLTSFTEIDPVFSASVAANITNNDIENWNNKSNFSGNYDDLNNKPFYIINLKNSTNNNFKNFVAESYCNSLELFNTNDETDLRNIENVLEEVINIYNSNTQQYIEFNTNSGKYTLQSISNVNNTYYTFSFVSPYFSNLEELNNDDSKTNDEILESIVLYSPPKVMILDKNKHIVYMI